MIAFGSSMTSPEVYAAFARPGVERAAEADSRVFAFQAAGSIFRTYNLILEQAACCADLEALVLVHQDAELADPDLCRRVRAVLGDPAVGVAGCSGAVDVDSMAWWEGRLTWGSSVYRYGDHGGGDLPGMAWSPAAATAPQTGEVETLDGVLLILSPWTVRNIRLDESLGTRHGHDFDLCQQVRAAGRKVVTADLGVIHHHSLDLVTNNEPWIAAHMRVAEKWDGRMVGAQGVPQDWQARARRAEAGAAAARLLVASKQLQADAAALEQEELLRELTASRSWRMTSPLRALNRRLEQHRSARVSAAGQAQ